MIVIFLIIVVLICWVIFRRARRKAAALDMQARPYRYPVETRRSRYAHRGGFK